MLDLKAQICKILQRLGVISDWIVDYGTSGIWTYRKWNSGIAECWGFKSANIPAKTVKSDVYVTLPSGLFIETPHKTLGLYAGGADLYKGWITTASNSKDQIRLTMINGYTSAIDMSMYITAIGLWKSLGGS